MVLMPVFINLSMIQKRDCGNESKGLQIKIAQLVITPTFLRFYVFDLAIFAVFLCSFKGKSQHRCEFM